MPKQASSSAAAVRMHAKRHGWRRRTSNSYGDRACVLVPAEAAVQPRSALYAERTAHVITHDQEGLNGRDQVNVRVIDQAIETLREQLARAEQRADADRVRAEHAERLLEEERGRVDEGRKRVDELRTALADAVAAERIAAGVAAGCVLNSIACRPGRRGGAAGSGEVSAPLPGHYHVDLPAAASRAHQTRAALGHRNVGAVGTGELGGIRFDLVSVGLTPHDQADFGCRCVAERHRRRIRLGSHQRSGG